jgi:hypothetical protein
MAEVDDSLFNRAEIAAQRDKEDLLDRLDVLLERYLYTLHEYQKVMQELTKQLSSVCFQALPPFPLQEGMLTEIGVHVLSPSQLPQLILCDSIRTGLL